MTDVLSFDNYVHPIPALKVVQPRECALPGTDTYRRPGARSRPVEWCKSGRVSACGSVVATMP
ncbi:hypothetical protein MAHJHV59_25810 [Mycobacterium avium subsp. hominissuis]